MKYNFSSEVQINLTPTQFKAMFKDIDPTSKEAEGAVKTYMQSIVDAYLSGQLISMKEHQKEVDESYSRGVNSVDPDDFRLRHGPGGR